MFQEHHTHFWLACAPREPRRGLIVIKPVVSRVMAYLLHLRMSNLSMTMNRVMAYLLHLRMSMSLAELD